MKSIVFLVGLMVPAQLLSMQADELTHSLSELQSKLNTLSFTLTQPQKTLIADPKLSTEFSFYNLDEHIFQRKVLQQTKNANCGYYALKDTLYTLQALEGSETDRTKLPIDLLSNNKYTEKYTKWMKAIAERRKPGQEIKLHQALALAVEKADTKKIHQIQQTLEKGIFPTDWLEGAEIEWLYKDKTPNKPATPIWIIDNIDWISEHNDYQGLVTNHQGLTILSSFREKETFRYGFLLNNAEEYTTKEGGVAGSSGHWFGVVVVKDKGIFTYYVTDSANRNRTNSTEVLVLKKFLEKDNITSIKIVVSGIQNNIDTIEHVKPAALGGVVEGYNGSQEQAIRTVLRNIEQALQKAVEKEFLAAPEFSGYKETLLTYLSEVDSTNKIPDEFKASLHSWAELLD